MRKLFKRLISIFLIPAIKFYLGKERKFTYQDVHVTVHPGVFHPGLFYSTKFLLSYLSDQSLVDQSFLELGCGSGLISIKAAKAGAIVTASDLSTLALKNASINADLNNVSISFIHSDLFEEFNASTYDWIVINPPYYAKAPTSEAELAWNCGENFEYFKKLFGSLGKFIHTKSNVIMVLTKGCDVDAIVAIARENDFAFELRAEKDVLFDGQDFIYRINRR